MVCYSIQVAEGTTHHGIIRSKTRNVRGVGRTTNERVANLEKPVLEPSQRDAYALAGLPGDLRKERGEQNDDGAVIRPPDPV